MGVIDEIVAASHGWMTVAEMAEATGRNRQSIRNALNREHHRALFETRFTDGRGAEYRRIPGASVPKTGPRSRPCPAIEAVAESLRGGPKTVREIHGERGWSMARVYGIVIRAEEAG